MRQHLSLTYKADGMAAGEIGSSPAELRNTESGDFSLFIPRLQVSVLLSERATDLLLHSHFLTLIRVPPAEESGVTQNYVVRAGSR